MFSYRSRSLSSLTRCRPAPTLASTGVGVGLLLAVLAILGLPAASAQAALLSSGGSCKESALSQPFAQWGDSNTYELVAQGDFEGSLSQWTLSGGASRASGSEPFGATGTVGEYSLALPAGSSAQSPYTCVTASDPTFRFFARNEGLLATVAVEVVYRTILGPVALPVGVVAASGAWQPTLPMLTGSVAADLLSGGTAEVALRFTALTALRGSMTSSSIPACADGADETQRAGDRPATDAGRSTRREAPPSARRLG